MLLLRQEDEVDIADALGRQLGEDIEFLCRQAFSIRKHGKIQIAFAVNPPGCTGPEKMAKSFRTLRFSLHLCRLALL